MILLKVVRNGDEATVVLTAEALALLNLQPGDDLCLSETPQGAVLTSAGDPERDERRERGRAFIRRYLPTFEALAK